MVVVQPPTTGVTTDLAISEAAGSGPLATLIAECAQRPACLRHLSSVATRQQVTGWLRETRERARIPIWVWLSYPGGVPPRWIQLNMRALARHADPAHFDVVLLNTSTLGRWLPLPPEFGRLKHAVAASDVARLGLLATYGGLYLDADVLVSAPLTPLLRRTWLDATVGLAWLGLA
jgi:hypothetical protein